MDKELKDILDGLNNSAQQLAKSAGVKTAANTNPPAATPKTAEELEIESKKLTSKTMDAVFEDPLRKNFERLAKASPSQFGYLGAMKTLEDPYAFIRAQKADGSYRIKNADLDLIIKGILAINAEDPEAHGATKLVEWAEKSGNPAGTMQGAFEQAFSQKSFGDNTPIVRKAVDSTVGAALIRTDIEPILREAFNRVFPAYEMFPKIPANGINHTWTQQTAYGSASLLDELGDYSAAASNNTYSRVATTNIAVAASQREIGLKAMFASQQSGMSFNLGGNNNLEVMGALIAIANVIQGQIFQGNYSVAAKTLDDEDGLTNTKGFDGFRQQLKGSGYSINKGSDTYLTVLRRAVGQLFDAGANMNEVAVFLSIGAQNALDAELETFYQYLKSESGNATPTNFSAAGLSMLNGILARLKAVPAQATQGNGIGYYTYSAAATEDIYVLDPNGTALPYIGSPSPTILELPTGWGNHLSNTYVPFLMIGMAIYVKPFNRKIRIAQTTI